METKDTETLKLYKGLLELLSNYTDTFDRLETKEYLKKTLSEGITIIPDDGRARDILSSIIFSTASIPVKIEALLEGTFRNVGITLRPRYLNGVIQVANWSKDDWITDKIIYLLNFNRSKEGCWCNNKNEQITLINKKEK